MTEKAGLRFSSSIKAMGWVLAAASALQLVGACTNLKGSLGADCIKDQDCQSNLCSQETCVAQPPLLDGAFEATDAGADASLEGGSGSDAGHDATVEAGVDAQAMNDVESVDAPASEDSPTSVMDSETAADVAADVEEESHPDASIDAPADVTVDSALDAHDDAADAGGPG